LEPPEEFRVEPRWHRSTFPTKRHERVHDLLARLVGEGTAHFFADACDISQRRPPYRTTRHLMGHLLREVESAVRDVLRSLPAVKDFMAEHPARRNESHQAEIDAILNALDLDANQFATSWRSFVGKGKETFVGSAHRDDLQLPLDFDRSFTSRFDLFVDVLSVVLDAAEANYASVVTALRAACSQVTPGSADVAFVSRHLAPGAAALSTVFAGLSAAWLVPLREARVFDAPPDVLLHDGGSYSFPDWPQAAYLERIAPDVPEEVAATIERVPVNDNELVHWAFLRAALRMPAQHAKRVAVRELPWLALRVWDTTPIADAVEKLALHLLSGGEVDAAFDLLRTALTLVVGDDEPLRWLARQARMSDWDFEQLIRTTVPALAQHDRSRTVAFLHDLLERAMKDETSSWRAAVEDHGQNRFEDPIDHIFVALRGLVERDVELGGENALRAAVAGLEARGPRIYARLALHLLRRFGESTPDLVVTRATSQDVLDSVEEFHELASMIADRFPTLSDIDRAAIMRALRENSTAEHIRAKYGDRGMSEEDVTRYARNARRQWFAILGANRPADANDEYRVLCRDGVELEHPTFLSWHGSLKRGPNSPIQAVALGTLTDEELLRYLADWAPTSDDIFEPSRRGLGAELKISVAKDPSRFARLAREFRGQHPQYVGNVLWGLMESSKLPDNGPPSEPLRTLDWDSILDLAEWVAAQRTEGAEDERDNPHAWTWSRQIAADIAENAALFDVRCGGNRLRRAWAIIETLLADADPLPDRVARTTMDDDTFSINTVRGQALCAAISLSVALVETD
jgi:hypothetical protein